MVNPRLSLYLSAIYSECAIIYKTNENHIKSYLYMIESTKHNCNATGEFESPLPIKANDFIIENEIPARVEAQAIIAKFFRANRGNRHASLPAANNSVKPTT